MSISNYAPEISLIQQGRAKEAIPRLISRIGMDGHNPDLHNNLALAFQDIGDTDRAERGFRVVLERWAGHPQAACNLGDLLARQNRFEEAEEVLSGNSHPHCRAALAMVKIEQLRIAEALADIKAIAEESGNAAAHSVYLGYSLHEGYDRAAHEAWLERFVPWSSPAPSTWNGERPVRIGYTGDVFRHCAVASMLELVLANHRTSGNVEVHVYSDVQPGQVDETTRSIQRLVQDWHPTGALSDMELAQKIKEDGIDVLIDTQGHKLGSRIMVHAKRPAALQYTYIGYAGDTLIGRNIDKEIGWAYRPPDARPDSVTPRPQARNGFVTFGSVNRAAKITAQTIRAWGQAMAETPKSRLKVMVKGGERNGEARRQLERHGVPGERLELAERRERNVDYLAFANEIDIHLDTVPYGGGATTADMLLMGVPTQGIADGPYQMGRQIMAGLPSGAEVAERLEVLIRRELKVAAECCS